MNWELPRRHLSPTSRAGASAWVGRGCERRRQPLASARPAAGGLGGASSGDARPFHLPPSRRSLRNRQRGRASLPPLAEAGAGSLRDEELPGRTRRPPIAGLRLNCGRRSRVPAEAGPPPSARGPRGSRPSPGRSPPTRSAGTSAQPGSRSRRCRQPPPQPATSPRIPRRAAPTGAGSRRAAPRLPPRHAAPASRGPGSPAQLSGPTSQPRVRRGVQRRPPASAGERSPLPTSAGTPHAPGGRRTPRAIHHPARRLPCHLPQPRASPDARSPPDTPPQTRGSRLGWPAPQQPPAT